MTAIVGLVQEGKVYIGSDSGSSDGYSITTSTVEKVFRNRTFLIGFTSSWRMGQLLRYAFTPPKRAPKQDAMAYMATAFVDAVRETLKQGGFAEKDKEKESGGTFLVGYDGHLFEVHDDYQVNESTQGYAACGGGTYFALGALHATSGLDPEHRIRSALEAAAAFSTSVRAPFLVLHE